MADPAEILTPKRHLLILDVDGTLVDSLEAEALLFPAACERALGIAGVPTGFESYRCPSDCGIVRELVELHFGREARAEDHDRVEATFLALIRDYYAREPRLCRPIAGAVEAVSAFRELSDVAVSIATAGWQRTALHKLEVAGVVVEGVPIATSNDAEWKSDIMRIATERASAHYGVREFETVICFGDSKGDVTAAGELGYDFIGIDSSGFVTDEKYTFADFCAFDEVVRTMRAIQLARRV